MMFKSAEAYSRMLRLQADISYKSEQHLFRNSYWKNAKYIADIGCGNGYYTSMLADKFPDKTFKAFEPNEELYKIAVKDHFKPNIEFYPLSYSDFQSEFPFDFIYARLMINQLSDRGSFIQWAKKNLKAGGGLLIIDADDDNFSIYPPLKLFKEIEDKTKHQLNSAGGCRNTKNLISAEVLSNNFLLDRFLTFSPNSLNTDKSLFYRYMLYTAKFEEGDSLSPLAYKELFEWFDNEDSFAQYGLYAALYIKGDQKNENV